MNQFFQRSIAAAAAVLALTAGLAAGAAETQSSSMPILMYHDLTQDPNKTSSMTITDLAIRRCSRAKSRRSARESAASPPVP